ncbi:Oidioi.mRNA.OKI2018_I69.XSR.g14055.t1.cds [Oikopleura dioica]|uniref:Oidioi.mRNA.OKI2018_I69.XSR.g14055.t1.cds n=1 Tax=Oikopleura dioica TaxID=34765 RepID=A0ABN7S8Q5_OIKDI|nr:Oidioi.mRNA.OKI2018_I69.XSR.g14055.t1.cds [Oikopleura dioica]
MQCNLKMIDPSGKGLCDCERPANSRKSIKFQVVVKTICPLHPETLYFIQRASMMRVPIELIPYNHREISLFNSRKMAACVNVTDHPVIRRALNDLGDYSAGECARNKLLARQLLAENLRRYVLFSLHNGKLEKHWRAQLETFLRMGPKVKLFDYSRDGVIAFHWSSQPRERLEKNAFEDLAALERLKRYEYFGGDEPDVIDCEIAATLLWLAHEKDTRISKALRNSRMWCQYLRRMEKILTQANTNCQNLSLRLIHCSAGSLFEIAIKYTPTAFILSGLAIALIACFRGAKL